MLFSIFIQAKIKIFSFLILMEEINSNLFFSINKHNLSYKYNKYIYIIYKYKYNINNHKYKYNHKVL